MAEAYICSLSKVQRHAEICKEINNLYERKNHDYGDSFHQTFVEEGMAMARIRLGDKFSRFKTLSRGTQTASKLFPDFPICVDDKFYFAGTSTKPKSSKSKTPCEG